MLCMAPACKHHAENDANNEQVRVGACVYVTQKEKRVGAWHLVEEIGGEGAGHLTPDKG